MQRKPIDAAGREKLKNIKGPLKGAMPPLFNKKQCIGVSMGEYAITDKSSDTPVVGSFGAFPCIIIALHDSKNNLAGCAHVSWSNDIQSLKEMIKFFAPSNTVAHLGGGNFDPGFCLAVVKFLEDKGIRVVNAHIDYTESNTNLSAIDALLASESLAIDARNGNLYSPVTFSIDMDLNKILKQVAEFKSDNSHSIPMKQIFNSLEMPAVKSKQAVVEEACSFHGLQAAFLTTKKPQAPVLQPNITKPASTDDSEPLFPGLRRGFLNNKPPVKSTNAPPQDGVQFRR